MKIGINARFLRKPGTGIGQVTREFLTHLAELPETNGHEIILFVEEPIESHVFTLPSSWHVESVSGWYTRDDRIREHLWERYFLPGAIKKNGCEVFFSLYQSATLLPRTMRHVMMVHDLIPLLFPVYLKTGRQRFHYRTIEKAIRQAERLLVPSHATEHDLERLLKIPNEKITVVPLGLASLFEHPPTPEEVKAVLATWELEPGYIYHGGGLEIRKNTEKLLEAYSLIKKKQPDFPLLVISGKIHDAKNPLAADVQGMVTNLGLEPSVKLLGFVEEEKLPALYAGALIFVYPSLAEGFGLPVLEALSMGTPVLTSDTSSLPEVAGPVALYCDPTNVADIRKKMEELYLNHGLREGLRESGPKRAARFSWAQFTKAAWKLLIQ